MSTAPEATVADATPAPAKKTIAKFSGEWRSPTEIAIALDGPLADPDRINLPIKKDAIESYKEHGVIDPIHVVKGPPAGTTRYLLGGVEYADPGPGILFAVDGRQRIRGAMLANQQLKAAKADHLIQIKVLVDPAPAAEHTLTEKLVIRNEHRTQDGALAKARKAARLKGYGQTNVQIGRTFGVEAATVAGWLLLLNCIPEIQQLVESGAIPARVASVLGKLPADQQKAELAKVAEAGATLGGNTGFDNANAAVRANAAGAGGEDAEESEARTPRAEKIRSRELFELYEACAPDDKGKFESDSVELIRALVGFMTGYDPKARALIAFDDVHSKVRPIIKERIRRAKGGAV